MFSYQNPDIARIAEETVLNLKEFESRIESLKADLAWLCQSVGNPRAAAIALAPAPRATTPYGAQSPLGMGQLPTVNPFSSIGNPFQQGTNPYSQGISNPLQQGTNPYSQGISNPFQQGINPYSQGISNPFQQGTNPYDQGVGTSPFQSLQSVGNNPYQTGFGSSPGILDPRQVAVVQQVLSTPAVAMKLASDPQLARRIVSDPTVIARLANDPLLLNQIVHAPHLLDQVVGTAMPFGDPRQSQRGVDPVRTQIAAQRVVQLAPVDPQRAAMELQQNVPVDPVTAQITVQRIAQVASVDPVRAQLEVLRLATDPISAVFETQRTAGLFGGQQSHWPTGTTGPLGQQQLFR